MRLRVALKVVKQACTPYGLRPRWGTLARAWRRIDRFDATDDKRRGLRPMTKDEHVRLVHGLAIRWLIQRNT